MEGEGNGARFFFSEGKLLGATEEMLLSEEEKKMLACRKESGLVELERRKIFVERLRKPDHLVICGGGHVAQQTALLAKQTGFQVTALEDRPLFFFFLRRAGADEVICDNFESGLKKIQGGSGTYFLILTRGHRYDGICLRAVLQKERAYIGMMASRGRAAAMKKELSGEGVSQETLEELHSPVGLSIHAETPSAQPCPVLPPLHRKRVGGQGELRPLYEHFRHRDRHPGGLGGTDCERMVKKWGHPARCSHSFIEKAPLRPLRLTTPGPSPLREGSSSLTFLPQCKNSVKSSNRVAYPKRAKNQKTKWF